MDTSGRTTRLELSDQSLREWTAVVLSSDPDLGVVLDRSAFYPGGGGQPPDHGVLLWGGVRTRIVGARGGDELYLLPHEDDSLPPRGHGGAGCAGRRASYDAHAHPLGPAPAVGRGVP